MVVAVGEILFTSLFTDNDSGAGTGESGFSFIATTNIAAGETITFHAPESFGNASFTFTVGAGGLAAADFVRITMPGTGNPTIIADPSGGSVGAIGFSGTMTAWSLVGADNIIASSGGIAIAGLTNSGGDGSSWDDNFASTGLDRVAIDAAIALPTDPLPAFSLPATTTDDNSIWQGGSFADIDNPAFWDFTNTPVDHAAPNINGTTFVTQAAATPCFAPGTLIATETGEVAVETLRIGDMLCGADGALVAVKWIGRHTAHKLRAGAHMEPVRISAGALGGGLPVTDLIVTADHGMIIDGLVINASALVNADTINFIPLSELPTRVVYYHIETEAHDVILANGTPVETFVDNVGRQAFDNYGEYLDLYGADRIIPEMDRPRISSRRLLPEAIRARLGIAEATVAFDTPLSA